MANDLENSYKEPLFNDSIVSNIGGKKATLLHKAREWQNVSTFHKNNQTIFKRDFHSDIIW